MAVGEQGRDKSGSRFVPVDLAQYVVKADQVSWVSMVPPTLEELPGGSQRFWGVPFEFGSADGSAPPMVVTGSSGSTDPVAIPIAGSGTHVVFAHMCDSKIASTSDVAGTEFHYSVGADTGEHLADYVVVYEDGSEAVVPVRRKIEIAHPLGGYDHGRPYAARPHWSPYFASRQGPIPAGMWGEYQQGWVFGTDTGDGSVWHLYALENPEPDRLIASVRIEPTGVSAIGIGAVTLFRGTSHPLHLHKSEALEVTRVDGQPVEDDVPLDIDLGLIGRRRSVVQRDDAAWLADPVRGRGEVPSTGPRQLTVYVSASPDATLSVDAAEIAMGEVYDAGQATSHDGTVNVRLLTPERTWVHGRVVDAGTGEPLSARIHMRSADGRYLPPEGHQNVVNTGYREDYSGDVRLGDTEYAYIDHRFQSELPVGEVYVEVSKGFEYEPLRAKVDIAPGQRELELRLERAVDWRSQGWVSADTHVHFISPQTAHLEGRAEGLNVIDVLAVTASEGPYNFADYTGALNGASTPEMQVWVGTQSGAPFTQISSLGVEGEPVLPTEVGLWNGDPMRRSVIEWLQETKAKNGLTTYTHFPFPHGGDGIAGVLAGLVDAIEILDFGTPTMVGFAYFEYYRFLNCGYRVPLLAGTDKMGANRAVGEVRTYGYLGDEEFTYRTWQKAAKAGRTFVTTGPLLSFNVEGHTPGDQLDLAPGGGSVHLHAHATSITAPIHRLEVIFNGEVIAEQDAPNGSRVIELEQTLTLPGSGWLAARCISEHKAWSLWPNHIAAHTSPVYVQAGEQRVFDLGTAQYLVNVVEGTIDWHDTLATIETVSRNEEMKQQLRDAITELKTLIQTYG